MPIEIFYKRHFHYYLIKTVNEGRLLYRLTNHGKKNNMVKKNCAQKALKLTILILIKKKKTSGWAVGPPTRWFRPPKPPQPR